MAKECSHPTPFDGVSFKPEAFFFGWLISGLTAKTLAAMDYGTFFILQEDLGM